MEAAGVARERSILSDDTVTWDDYWNGIAAIGGGCGADHFYISQSSCNVLVAVRFGERYLHQFFPNIQLKMGALQMNRHGKVLSRSIKVFIQLTHTFMNDEVVRLMRCALILHVNSLHPQIRRCDVQPP